jgi:hypothetical protein
VSEAEENAMRLSERIPRESFQGAFRPMVRSMGSKNVIIRLNEAARTAIPRQTKLAQLMPKLELLCYEQNRPKVDEELERLWGLYLDDRLGEAQDDFYDLSDELNKNLEGENLPADQEKLGNVKGAIQKIVKFLDESELTGDEVELVFRIKAFPEVLNLYLDEFQKAQEQEQEEA